VATEVDRVEKAKVEKARAVEEVKQVSPLNRQHHIRQTKVIYYDMLQLN
jgi:hypothetical protein